MAESPLPVLPDAALREVARRVYGEDPAGYDAGRPDYPERVFEVLRTRCGLVPGAHVLEVGPGTGRVTRRLLADGARVTAVEPDPALAAHLSTSLEPVRPTVVGATFEVADLPEASFDLIVSAMAWHWVDQSVGLPRLGRLVRPGGWVALWWTVFGDPSRPDPFRDATAHLLPVPAARATSQRPPFELDADAWAAALVELAGLTDTEAVIIPWTATLDPAAIRALHASTIAVRALPPAERTDLLDELVRIAERDFGATVARPMVTGLHTARRPEG